MSFPRKPAVRNLLIKLSPLGPHRDNSTNKIEHLEIVLQNKTDNKLQILCLAFIKLKSQELKRESNETLATQVTAIKNQFQNIKTEVLKEFEDIKLFWQLEALKIWYQDEFPNKCARDLSYIFQDWTVIQRRLDGTENFYRNWSEYQQGFGDKNKEFFFGLQPLHQLIKEKGDQELLIVLGDHDKQMTYAKYNNFVLGLEEEFYKIKELGSYTGTAGDSLTEQVGNKFTTLDRDNDESKLHNCAKLWKGAWWFGFCHQSHLNGPYLNNPVSEKGEKGITWDLWRGMNYSLKFVLMMVRSKN